MEIQTLNPATPRQRQRIEAFLKRNGLRIDDMNYYAAVLDDDGEMIAGGGLKDDVIKCVAVDDAHKGEAIANTLVSHLISHANQEGYSCIKLFTKPKTDNSSRVCRSDSSPKPPKQYSWRPASEESAIRSRL